MTLQPSAAADRTFLDRMQLLDRFIDATPSIKKEHRDPVLSSSRDVRFAIQSLPPQCLEERWLRESKTINRRARMRQEHPIVVVWVTLVSEWMSEKKG